MLLQSQHVRDIKDVVDASLLLRDGIQETPGLKLVGNSWLNIIAFTVAEDPHLVKSLQSCLRDEGWHFRTLDNPPALQVCLTNPMAVRVQELMSLIRQKLLLVRNCENADIHGHLSIQHGDIHKTSEMVCCLSKTQHYARSPIFQRYSECSLLALFGNVCGR